jgi:hypothetical protein
MQKNTNFDSAAIISGEILSRHFRNRNGKKISPVVKNKKKKYDAYQFTTVAKTDEHRTYS